MSTKRKRRSGDETIGYLREKSETERKVREQEIELKKAQVALQQQQAAQSQNAGDDDGNTTTTTAESKHDSLASATTATIYESHAKFP